MKKVHTILIAAACTLALTTPVLADSGQGTMKGMQGMQKGAKMEMGSDARMGKSVHTSKVEGFELAYHLIDMKELMKGKKSMMKSKKGMDMPEMTSHHLMVYVQGPDGKPAEGAKVGFKVTGPDGSDQKAMAMEMKGAYGANLNFETKGSYAVKTKLIVGDHKLVDQFTYEVE